MRQLRAWLLLSCGALSACTLNSVNGSGNVVTETRPVSGFSSVSLSGSGRLIIEQTGTESLTVTSDDNLLPYLKTVVNGNRLELGKTDPSTNLEPTSGIVFRLTVKALEDLAVSGSGQVEAKGLGGDHLEVAISGSGEVLAQGTSGALNLAISGSGAYNGEQLKSRQASVTVSGSGSALMAVSDRLDASVSGSGSVRYIGTPRVNQQVSGSGSVNGR